MSARKRAWGGLLPAAIAVLACLPSAAQARPELTVFAASDLGPALTRIVPAFERVANAKVTTALGSSGMLAQQIRQGAPADLYFSADESFVDSLIAEHVLVAASRTNYARGRLVLAASTSAAGAVTTLRDLTQPAIRRVAIANPAHAPYGRAARQALEAAGVWSAVEPKLVFAENVQQAMQFVRSGSADTGVVARSVVDASGVTWTLVDSSLHAPISQTAAVVARTKQRALAFEFLAHMNGAEARSVMRQLGFLLPGEAF